MTCSKCDTQHDPTKCQGHVIKDPETREPIDPRQCAKTPVKGSTVCRSHGAGRGTPARAKAEERLRDEAAGRLLARVHDAGAAPVTDAVSAMQALAGQLTHSKDVLGAMVGHDLEACESCGRYDVPIDSAQGVAWLRVIRELRQLLEAMERLGIAQRFVQVEAARVELIAAALGRVFDELGLDEEQRALGGRVLMAELRAGDVVS